MKIKMPVFVFNQWLSTHTFFFCIVPVSTKGIIRLLFNFSGVDLCVFSLTHSLIHCGALVRDLVFGQDPSLLPLLMVSCQGGKPRCLLEGNPFAVRAHLSALFPVIPG